MPETLSSEERAILKWISAESRPVYARRADLLLLHDEGLAAREIGPQVGLTPRRVRYWLQGFRERRMEVFPEDLLATGGAQLEAPGQDAAERAIETSLAEPPPDERPADSIQVGVTDEGEVPQKTTADRPPSRRERPEVLPGDPMSEAGRKVLRFHFERMLEHEPGTRQGEDIEELHDMRVATRRMRSAFRVFAPYFSRDVLRPLLKGLRRTGRRLGRVRDLDVFMEKAGRFLEGASAAETSDLDPLLASWREQREAAREEMLAYLDSSRYQRFVEEFGLFVSTEGAGAVVPPPGKPVAYRVYQVVPALIYDRYEVVRGYESVVADAPLEVLHALRIDCKRLRYAIEFFREVLGPQARKVIKEVVAVQDHLGELHDADVACRLLIEFLDGWSGQEGRERIHIGGVTRYLVSRQNELRALVDSFPQLWRHLHRPEVRRQLALAVSVL